VDKFVLIATTEKNAKTNRFYLAFRSIIPQFLMFNLLSMNLFSFNLDYFRH
jgi:hypothetical protein